MQLAKKCNFKEVFRVLYLKILHLLNANKCTVSLSPCYTGSIIVLDCTSCPRHFSLGWRNTKRFRKWLNRKCPCRAPDNKTTAIEEIRGDSCAKPAQDDCTVIELEEPKPARTNIVTSKPKRAVLKTKQILSN